ncbi:MAG: 30S ribosomal protein S18 [Microgenomates group bacterium]
MAARILRRKKKTAICFFCKEKKEPNYKDFETLRKHLTDRSKIIGQIRTGLCAKHQRRLSIAVKRARHLGLLPFVTRM